MDLIRGALDSLVSILSSARQYEPSDSSDFRQKLVEGLNYKGFVEISSTHGNFVKKKCHPLCVI